MALSRTIIAQHAVVASEQPLASLAGYDVLRKGGNAFDAAAATSFALAVTFHPAGGLGGDFFGVFYEAKTGRVHCLNASGWSPSGLNSDLITSSAGGKVPQFGPLSCVVPGFVAGVWEMQKRFGSTVFRELLQRPAELALGGFPAGEGICRSVAGAYQGLSPDAKAIFAPSGKPTLPGEWIRQKALAKVISEVAEAGADAFYRSWPAERIASALDALGVPCKQSDFADYRPEWVEPLTLDYRGTTVYEVPPNSMGATSLLILKLLSQVDLSRYGPLSKDRIALTMRAVLPAYAKRDELLGDPRFGKIDLEEFMSGRETSAPPPSRIRSGDTTAFSVADAEGNVVSGIQSLFQHFGSRVFVPDCGIALNNRASGFSMSGPNRVEPRKRPLHTLSSMILARGERPYLAIGASGGDYRPLQHALFVTNSVDYGMAAEQNVAHQRFLWGGAKTVLVEQGYELPSGEGYDFQSLPMPGRTGVCQAVEITSTYRKGVCDVRGDGLPAGF
jgi:gamma-glutamyltranspeptidase / glutathione hydrolase